MWPEWNCSSLRCSLTCYTRYQNWDMPITIPTCWHWQTGSFAIAISLLSRPYSFFYLLIIKAYANHFQVDLQIDCYFFVPFTGWILMATTVIKCCISVWKPTRQMTMIRFLVEPDFASCLLFRLRMIFGKKREKKGSHWRQMTMIRFLVEPTFASCLLFQFEC